MYKALVLLIILLIIIALYTASDASLEASNEPSYVTPITDTVTTEIRVITVSNPLPYREGDWFKYRADIETQIGSCWAEFMITVIDIEDEEVTFKAEITNFGGHNSCLSIFKFERGASKYISVNVYDAEIGEPFIDPSVSGTHRCREGVLYLVK